MTFSSSHRRPERRRPTTARRTTRRLNTTAGAVARQSTGQDFWLTQRTRLILAALVSLLVMLLFLFFGTEHFYVYTIAISGNKYVSTPEIESISGIKNYSIFFVDAGAVEERLNKLPEFKSVRVSSRLPNQVTITLEERAPEITWMRGNEAYWIAGDGVVLTARVRLTDLPLIQDLDQTPIKPGDFAPRDAVNAFWALREAWSSSPRAFEWSYARGLAYTDDHGWKIYLGNADDMPEKIFRLREITRELLEKKIAVRFIDVGRGQPFYQ